MSASYEGGVLLPTRYGKTEVMATGSANLHIALLPLVYVLSIEHRHRKQNVRFRAVESQGRRSV
jgi:hypothetical protein